MSKVTPTKVNDSGFTRMLERMGEDCGPLQFVREFYVNSKEAIERTGGKGTVLIDVDWDLYELSGEYKLSFTDNGDGMTGEEMQDLLNQLSSSGERKNQYENYGMGAKIAGMTRNPNGLWYQSWKGNKGSTINLIYDEDNDQFGLQY